MFLVLDPALLFAFRVIECASRELARVHFAEALLEMLLGLVAFQVNLQEGMVVMLALVVEHDPLFISGLVPGDFTLKPAAELAGAMARPCLAVTGGRVRRFFRSWVGRLIRVRNRESQRLPVDCSVAVGQVWAQT